MAQAAVELKVFYNLDDINCVAKGSGPVTVTLIGDGNTVGRLDLYTCLHAAIKRSPELVNDKQADYSVYTLDATEDSGEFFEGQGLLSWTLADGQKQGQVTGKLRTNVAGMQMIEVKLQLKRAPATTQSEFKHHMATYDAVARMLPIGFDHSNWSELMRQAATLVHQPHIQQHAQTLLSHPAQFATHPRSSHSIDSAKVMHSVGSIGTASRGSSGGKAKATGVTTLHKVREQKARELARSSSTMQNMSAQLSQARQQSVTQKLQAQRIAQQAVAAQRQQQGIALSRTQSEGDAMISDFPSPLLPTPSSPPQMRTFAPPPPATTASTSSAASVRGQSTGTETGYALPELQRSSSNSSQNSNHKRKASARLQSRSPKIAKHDLRDSKQSVDPFPASSMAAAQVAASGTTTATRAAAVAEATQSIRDAIAERQDAEMMAALREGRTPKFCGNCGAIQTRGYWRSVEVNAQQMTLCNPCGVYFKNKHVMRPEKLWQQHSARLKKQEEQQRQRERQSGTFDAGGKGDHDEPVHFTRTSPMRAETNGYNTRYRAVQSSPARLPPRSQTPTQALGGLPVETPTQQQQPSPSPAQLSNDNARDLAALLRTPRRLASSASKLLSCGSASPWRSMFTTFTEDSPSRQKFDKFLEELAMQDASGTGTPASTAAAAAAAAALVAASPGAQGMIDFQAMFGSPSRNGLLSVAEGSPTHAAGMQAGMFNLASFMSSPPSMGNFTSEPLIMEETLTPQDGEEGQQQSTQDSNETAKKKGKDAETPSSVTDGLFTPKRATRHAKTPSSITRRALRSAGSLSNIDAFGGHLN